MKKNFLLALLSFLALPGAFAQPAVVSLPIEASFLADHTALLSIPLSQIDPFLAYAVEWEGSPQTRLHIRFYESDRGVFGEWIPLEHDAHSEREAPRYLSHLGFAPAASTHFELRLLSENGRADLDLLRCHFFNPGKTTASQTGPALEETLGGCPCPIPAFQDRLDWCPAGNCPTDPTPVATAVTHLIVHHSAGANTSSDWAAVVRSIWNLHVNTNGWDDVGYHWLIDPNGVLYAGRGNDLLGAHFCGTNGATMGVCIMGTYSSVPPSAQSLETLKKLLAWKACDRDIDPEDFEFHPPSGLNLFNISGHRDGCSTACPGDSLYTRLPVLRQNVRAHIDACEISSVEKSPEEQYLQVFPNPTRDVLNIQLAPVVPIDFSLRLFDGHGRLIWQSAGAHRGGESISIPVNGFSAGWYTLLSGPGGAASKILIQ